MDPAQDFSTWKCTGCSAFYYRLWISSKVFVLEERSLGSSHKNFPNGCSCQRLPVPDYSSCCL